MKVTRDVILDLWPVYEAGEASAETRALVEEYLQQDPEFARLVRENGGTKALRPRADALPRDAELETLVRTQRLMSYRRSVLLLALTLLGASSFLRIWRSWLLFASVLTFLAWAGLMVFGRRWLGLPRRQGRA
jgi:hypothetical protein